MERMLRLRAILKGALIPLLFATILPLSAQDVSHETLLDVVLQFASGLSEGNAESAIAQLDTTQPAMSKLSYQIRALIANGQISATIDPLEWIDNSTVILDWFFELKSEEDAGGTVRKRERITCRFAKKGKRWKIVALEPAEFFKS